MFWKLFGISTTSEGGWGGKRGWQILKDVAYSSEVINNLTCIMFENT